jgi:hypothetical protein
MSSTKAFYSTFTLPADEPTGETPAKKAYPKPARFTATSPHARILARHRAGVVGGATAGAGAGAGACMETEEVTLSLAGAV